MIDLLFKLLVTFTLGIIMEIISLFIIIIILYKRKNEQRK